MLSKGIMSKRTCFGAFSFLFKGGFILPNNQRKAKKFTKQIANQIAQMLHDGHTEKEIRDELLIHNNDMWKWTALSVFGLPDTRTPEEEILRDAIFDVMLGETLLKRVLEVSSDTTEKRILKVTTLLNLTSTEAAALERKGNKRFVEEFDGSAVNLKVEETIETIPPAISLLEKLLKLAEGNVSVQNALKQLTPFNPIDSELEDDV